ncbi:MAG: IS256 family transposase [Pyrinomonadaceae bacterium]|nr:IS256 family transposase [Pyrinomonadaceae bacterium]
MQIRPEILDELIKGYKNPEDLIGENGLLKKLTKALLERAMSAELTHTLGYEKGEQTADKPTDNRRNGSSSKTVSSKNGEMQIAVPRDRNGEFEPQIIKKHQRRFDGFDDLILSLYSRGLSTREIQSHIEEIYGVEVSPELVSNVTEAVQEEVREWQQRTLEAVYPIIYLDALRVKIRVDGRVQNRCIYIGIGVNVRGKKETLGLWSSENEGAKFWLSVLTELQNRGVRDVLIACVDGLKGFPEAIESVFPKTLVQICIVHQIRNSLAFVSYQERKRVAADLKRIYSAATVNEALFELELFAEKWDGKYPLISKSWRANWTRIEPMFGFPAEIRRAIYTTNIIESLNMSLRKITKTRAVFPSDEAAFKLLWLGLRNIEKKWTMPIQNWKAALQQFAIIFDGRLPLEGLE